MSILACCVGYTVDSADFCSLQLTLSMTAQINKLDIAENL